MWNISRRTQQNLDSFLVQLAVGAVLVGAPSLWQGVDSGSWIWLGLGSASLAVGGVAALLRYLEPDPTEAALGSKRDEADLARQLRLRDKQNDPSRRAAVPNVLVAPSGSYHFRYLPLGASGSQPGYIFCITVSNRPTDASNAVTAKGLSASLRFSGLKDDVPGIWTGVHQGHEYSQNTQYQMMPTLGDVTKVDLAPGDTRNIAVCCCLVHGPPIYALGPRTFGGGVHYINRTEYTLSGSDVDVEVTLHGEGILQRHRIIIMGVGEVDRVNFDPPVKVAPIPSDATQ